MELSSVILTTGSSVGFFSLVNAGFGKLPMPESACRNAWKWRNISTSFAHSVITAIWAVLCFFLHPRMAEDLIETHSVFSHALVSFSIGYFIYDFLDMVVYQKLSTSWELLFHHTVDWGFEMKYKGVALLPNLAINKLALETPEGRLTVKKWKDVPFTVEDFSFEEYCQDNFPDLLD